MIDTYFYNEQLRKYIVQFMAIFSGLNIRTGRGASGQPQFVPCPVRYGSADRVVESIRARNTQNVPLNLPVMSAYMTGIQLGQARAHGTDMVDRRVYLPPGGVFPDDLEVIERLMPIPYNLEMSLSVYASSTDEAYQIIEQILMLFNPILQIQKSDSPMDWTRVTYVELLGIGTEENWPMGSDRRIIVWTFNFLMPIYLSAPMNFKNAVVNHVNIQIGDLSTLQIETYDDEGNVVPWEDPADHWTTITVPDPE